MIRLLRGKKPLFGVSYFTEDELEIVFLEGSEGRYRLVAKEKIQVTATETLALEETSSIRNKLRIYQARSPVWIHLALRSVAFVKAFSLAPVPGEELEASVSKRVREEIPYLAEEVTLHRLVRESNGGGSAHVVLFGVSKVILADQLRKLETYGIIPNRVMLSTELLNWIYETRISGSERADHSILLIHFLDSQAELLFFENHLLLQSRWISQVDQMDQTREAFKVCLASFQREWRRKPNAAIVLGPSSGELRSMISDLGIEVKFISSGVESEQAFPVLVQTAVDALRSDQVFDFTSPDAKQVRELKASAKKRSKLATSLVCLSFSLFFLALVESFAIFGQMGWLKFRIASLAASVQEVKHMRTQAHAVSDFYLKKSLPIFLLASLRKAIPDDLLLEELEFEERGSRVSVRGSSSQQAHVDQFIARLEEEALFERLTLEHIQAERGDGGGTIYHFAMKGILKMNEAR